MESKQTTRRTPTQVAKLKADHYKAVALQAIAMYRSVAHRLDMEAKEWDCHWPKGIAADIKANVADLQEQLHRKL